MHPSAKDYTGFKCGRLTAIRPTEKRMGHNIVWECSCECGGVAYVDTSSLKTKTIISCGCAKKKDLSGLRSGRLVAIEATDRRSSNGSVMWRCLCSCGNICYIRSDALISASTKSCGCLQVEAVTGRKGPLSPSWKFDKTDEERLNDRSCSEYSEWHKAVFERDDYTCQKCGERGGKLRTNHILGYADNKNERTLLSNGITLCKKCHKNYHHVYGNIATEETFNEWMEKE